MNDEMNITILQVKLDAKRLFKLGGQSDDCQPNSRMIGQKWSPTCKQTAPQTADRT